MGGRRLAAALISLLPGPAGACQLGVAGALLPGRIARLDLVIEGAVAGTAAVPAAWTVSVTNDPPGRSTVWGHAVVGAAFLSPDALGAMLTFDPGPGVGCDALAASGTLTIYWNDRMVPLRLDRTGFRFDP